jgi:hypothetical protein
MLGQLVGATLAVAPSSSGQPQGVPLPGFVQQTRLGINFDVLWCVWQRKTKHFLRFGDLQGFLHRARRYEEEVNKECFYNNLDDKSRNNNNWKFAK